MRTGAMGVKVIACMITIVAIGSAQEARAGVYPTNKCVSAKMAATAAYCQSALKAWSTWDKKQDDTKRDGALHSAATKLADDWNKAETNATKKGIDCAQTTLTLTALQSLVDAPVTGIAGIKDEINGGLDLGNKDNAKCGSKLLSAAAKKCAGLLKAEATYIKKLGKNMAAANRDAEKTKASDAFANSWSKATAQACPTSATKTGVETSIDGLNDQVVTDTTVSPNVDNTTFTTITPHNPTQYLGKSLQPVCMDGLSPYAFFVKRGSVNKLVMYYQGGGACWEQLTCGYYAPGIPPTCKTTVDQSDNPNNQSSGFGNLSNSSNPFKDWNIVFVPYCSCDIHYGDAVQDYINFDPAKPVHVVHHGFHNAKVAEKWAREHFVNPDMVFVTGSSAGAYGAVYNAPLLEKVWPASQFRVLGDAGNGVITSDFLKNEFPKWNFRANLPTKIPGLLGSFSGDSPTGMVGYMEAVAAYFPNTKWANYATAFDGGVGGQTGFYNIMLHGNAPGAALTWWEGSCQFNTQMVQQANDTYTAVHATSADNYRYYIGNGSRHTMWGSDKVYTDTSGGVQLIVDWINAMLTGGPDWGNVGPSLTFNVLLLGDPQPSPLVHPFESSDGGVTVTVNCP
jgi:hypothetical protein